MYYMSHYFTLLFPFLFTGLGLYGWWTNKKIHWYSQLLKRNTKKTPNLDPVFDKLEIMEQTLDEEKEISSFQNRMKGIATFSIFLMMMFIGLVYVKSTLLNSMVADSATQSTQNQ